MTLPLALRTPLVLAAGGLAACAGAGTGGAGQAPTTAASVMLISRSSPTLTLLSEGTRAPRAPNANAAVRKVVSAEGMEALIATFEAERMFQYALRDAPTGARQALQLDRGGERSVWVFSGSTTDERRASFVKARNYFLQLFNYARNYQPDDAAKQDMKASRKLESDRRRRRS